MLCAAYRHCRPMWAAKRKFQARCRSDACCMLILMMQVPVAVPCKHLWRVCGPLRILGETCLTTSSRFHGHASFAQEVVLHGVSHLIRIATDPYCLNTLCTLAKSDLSHLVMVGLQGLVHGEASLTQRPRCRRSMSSTAAAIGVRATTCSRHCRLSAPARDNHRTTYVKLCDSAQLVSLGLTGSAKSLSVKMCRSARQSTPQDIAF